MDVYDIFVANDMLIYLWSTKYFTLLEKLVIFLWILIYTPLCSLLF